MSNAIIDIAQLAGLAGSGGGRHVKISDFRGHEVLWICNSAVETTHHWKPDRDYKVVNAFAFSATAVISRNPAITLSNYNTPTGINRDVLVITANVTHLNLEWPVWAGDDVCFRMAGSAQLRVCVRSIPDWLLAEGKNP